MNAAFEGLGDPARVQATTTDRPDLTSEKRIEVLSFRVGRPPKRETTAQPRSSKAFLGCPRQAETLSLSTDLRHWPDAGHWEDKDFMVRIAMWRREDVVPSERNETNGK